MSKIRDRVRISKVEPTWSRAHRRHVKSVQTGREIFAVISVKIHEREHIVRPAVEWADPVSAPLIIIGDGRFCSYRRMASASRPSRRAISAATSACLSANVGG